MIENTLDARVAFLQGQVHAINLAIQQAKARGDQAAIDNLRTLWRKIMQQIIDLQGEAYKDEMPSQFMLTLDSLSDEAISVGKQIGESAVDITKGAATLVKALPIILLVALVLVGLVWAGKFAKDTKK